MSKRSIKRIFVTGGAGFIGSAFIRYLLTEVSEVKKVVNLDLLTYAANLKSLATVEKDSRYQFVRGNILNRSLIEELIRTHEIEAIVHFAAETHVDRSIENPHSFYQTNVEGTVSLLEVLRRFPSVHFHHVSTDEVYGSIPDGEFSENSPYSPNSPYAASKAASDHFVKAYAKTYDLSVTLSHSGNNYGPYQNFEKFIPKMIYNCLKKQPLSIYGKGINVRDWIFVDDHVHAIWLILQKGKKSENYNIGGEHQMQNIDLLQILMNQLAKLQKTKTKKFESLITFVKDRPGHDLRYALNCEKVKKELGWLPKTCFPNALEKTIQWYVDAWK